ncbi:Smr/MutS family protein [Roseomonas gilardii subsp. gilardii]|uniref:Smr/MutS family protein n=1 Tax=Roseomonas gilardii TaxID=257708 RepID=UPI001FFBBE08|nr:Smr/MutS family protein [Roseomonas gilardii]UPG73279.1 Smr/MutS family protein [Roseomonas gilardii subsp. gilardii]
MARRPRGLSDADRRLWRAWVAINHVAALPGHAPPPAEPASPPAPAETAAAPPPEPAARPAAKPARPTMPELQIGQPGPGLDAKRWKELRKGRIKPERVLDLHGRRVQDAHAAVLSFILAAHADDLRCVAIVTGKGSGEGGVLRRELPHWLNLPPLRPLLLGISHAHAANTGAVHLLLRRRERVRGFR